MRRRGRPAHADPAPSPCFRASAEGLGPDLQGVADVGTVRFLEDGVQVVNVNQRLEPDVVRAAWGPYLEPARLAPVGGRGRFEDREGNSHECLGLPPTSLSHTISQA